MTDEPKASARLAPPVHDLIAHARDYPQIRVYSWERHGEFFSLYPGEDGEPPYDAPEILVRLVNFPGAAVREIFLEARMRTHHHIAYEDILFYQVSGRRVQIVNERSREVNPGDASIQIAGVHKRVDQIIPGFFIEFSMVRPAQPGAEAQWIAAEEAPLVVVAQWLEGDDICSAEGDAAAQAPPHASRHRRRTFNLQGYQLHDIWLPKSATMRAPAGLVDRVCYVVDGQMKVTIGDTSDVVADRAAMRAPAGAAFTFEALTDAHFIYAPVPPERPQHP